MVCADGQFIHCSLYGPQNVHTKVKTVNSMSSVPAYGVLLY